MVTGPGGRVLPVPARRRRRPDRRHARRRRLLRPDAGRPGRGARRDIVLALEQMGFEVEAAHHEVAPGQHEIDFQYADARHDGRQRHRPSASSSRRWRCDHGLHATFMPKPIFGVNGSGMHVTPVASWTRRATTSSTTRRPSTSSRQTALHYTGGILRHAARLRGGHQPARQLVQAAGAGLRGAGQHRLVACATARRSSASRRGAAWATRIEVRMPDPSCNPYLAFGVMLASGLDGVKNRMDPGEPVDRNIFKMSEREKRRLRIEQLPANLSRGAGQARTGRRGARRRWASTS